MTKAKTYDSVKRVLYFTETTRKISNKIEVKEGKQIPLLNIYKDRL